MARQADLTSDTGFVIRNARWLSAGALLTLLSCFGQTFFISLFAGEIRAEFGLSHGEWGGIYSAGTMVSAVVMVWAGVLSDMFRVRALGTMILFGVAVACLVMAGNQWFWGLVGSIFLLRFFGQGMATHIAMVAMARWFVATRGRALAIATLGFSFGEALLPVTFVALMPILGWRVLWVICAGLAILGIPILMTLLKQERSPRHQATDQTATGIENRHWTRAQALKHPLFWFIVPSILGPSACSTAFFFHQVHLAEIKGWTHLEFVAWFPVFTGVSVLSMVGAGWALDKVGTHRLMPLFQLPVTIGYLIFAWATEPTAVMFGFIFLALTTGANATIPAAFWAETYGTAHIGAIKSLATAIMVLGTAIGPGITGVLIDAGISLETQFIGFVAYFLVTSLGVAIGLKKYGRL
ncbi:MFS transporter [Rhodobacteraceae bacterium M382]|nr:MFS transporter [Rhodobacteraceae bacterium M382]